jgi:hypothetical protein
MPALFGNANFKRFFVDGQPGDGFPAKALKSLNARAFSPTSEVETVSFGWVPMTDPLANKMASEDVFVGQFVCLGFRMDERLVRTADVRDELKQRTRELQYEKGRRLSRQERAVLKDAVLAELRARAFIRRRVAELVWQPARQEARLFGAPKPLVLACSELFARTFQFELLEVNTELLMRKLGWQTMRSSTTKQDSPAPSGRKLALEDADAAV